MEPGPLHNEYRDRAMVFAVEADYAPQGTGNCVTICSFTAFYAPDI